MTFLSRNCERRTIKRSTKTRAERRFTAEHGESWLRKSDGDSQAIFYWWHMLTGGEDYSVEQFTAPDEECSTPLQPLATLRVPRLIKAQAHLDATMNPLGYF